jgi:hypothetical protein
MAGQSLQKGASRFTYEGRAGYNSLTYILAGLLGAPTGTGTWTFKPAFDTADTPKAFTLYNGGAAGAEKAAYGMFNSLRMRRTKTECSISGDGFARILDEAPASPTVADSIPAVLINPKDIEVQVSTDNSAWTALSRELDFELQITGRWGQLYTGKVADPSFSDIVELAPTCMLTVDLEHSSESKGFVTDYRAQTLKYIKLAATGPVIGAGPDTHVFEFSMPFEFTNPRGAGDQQGVVGRYWDLQSIQDDDTFAGWCQAVLTNSLSAL